MENFLEDSVDVLVELRNWWKVGAKITVERNVAVNVDIRQIKMLRMRCPR